jgi:heme exporter protein B
MKFWAELGTLIDKEVRLEWRQKYAIGGVILYVCSSIFVVYIAILRPRPEVWNALFWIIALFGSVNAVTKSFTQENAARQLYFYQLANPLAVIVAKIIYNFIFLSLLQLLAYAVLSVLTIHPVKDMGAFFVCLGLGSSAFSITFTFISAIAAKTNNAATMLAILSFPVVIPILITLIKLSANALRLINDTSVWRDIVILLAIDVILLALSSILFPLLWRD